MTGFNDKLLVPVKKDYSRWGIFDKIGKIVKSPQQQRDAHYKPANWKQKLYHGVKGDIKRLGSKLSPVVKKGKRWLMDKKELRRSTDGVTGYVPSRLEVAMYGVKNKLKELVESDRKVHREINPLSFVKGKTGRVYTKGWDKKPKNKYVKARNKKKWIPKKLWKKMHGYK